MVLIAVLFRVNIKVEKFDKQELFYFWRWSQRSGYLTSGLMDIMTGVNDTYSFFCTFMKVVTFVNIFTFCSNTPP